MKEKIIAHVAMIFTVVNIVFVLCVAENVGNGTIGPGIIMLVVATSLINLLALILWDAVI